MQEVDSGDAKTIGEIKNSTDVNSVGPTCGEEQLAIHMALLLASGRERVLGFLVHPTQLQLYYGWCNAGGKLFLEKFGNVKTNDIVDVVKFLHIIYMYVQYEVM